jgi:hypothetical protein
MIKFTSQPLMRRTPQELAKKTQKIAGWEKKAMRFWNQRKIDVPDGDAQLPIPGARWSETAGLTPGLPLRSLNPNPTMETAHLR